MKQYIFKWVACVVAALIFPILTTVGGTANTVSAVGERDAAFDPTAAGLHNIAMNKKTSGGRNAFGYASAALVDGNTSTSAATGTDSHILIDLGSRYSIEYLEFYTANRNNVKGFKIIASNTPDFTNADDILKLCEMKEAVTPNAKYGFRVETEAKYRYIRFEGTEGVYTPINEIMVYSSAEINVDQWILTDTANRTIRLRAEGKTLKDLSVTVHNYSGDYTKTVTILVLLYNADGKLMKMFTPQMSTLLSETNPITLHLDGWLAGTVPSGYTLQAIMLDNVTHSHMPCAAFTV